MDRRLVSPRTVLVGILLPLLIIAILGAIVGIEAVLDVLADADSQPVLLALCVTAIWLVAWGLSLFVSLTTLGVPVSPRRSIVVYASATFLNNLTPFAQVGGEALSAAVIARSTDAAYETGLAAVTAVDVVNLVPSPLFAFAGLAWLVATGNWAPSLYVVAISLFGVSMALVVVGGLTWRYRTGVGRTITRVSVDAVATANRVTGRVMPVDLPRFAGRVETYLGGVSRVFGHGRRLGVCLGLSSVGWAALVVAFWLSLQAVGHPIPFAFAAVVLPVGMLAIAVPLPGGVGGVEAALVGLLVGVGEVPVATATAGVVVYRATTYWAPLLFGGVVTALLTVDGRRS